MKNIKCQKAHSGIVSSRQGLGKPGLWLVTYTKNKPAGHVQGYLCSFVHGRQIFSPKKTFMIG